MENNSKNAEQFVKDRLLELGLNINEHNYIFIADMCLKYGAKLNKHDVMAEFKPIDGDGLQALHLAIKKTGKDKTDLTNRL